MGQLSEPETRNSVLLIEPDDAVRRSRLKRLRSVVPRWAAIGASSVEAATSMAQAESPSLVLVDIADPEMNGPETMREIKRAVPRAQLIALTMRDDEADCDDLRSAGTSACLLIWEIQTELPSVFEKVLSEGST